MRLIPTYNFAMTTTDPQERASIRAFFMCGHFMLCTAMLLVVASVVLHSMPLMIAAIWLAVGIAIIRVIWRSWWRPASTN